MSVVMARRTWREHVKTHWACDSFRGLPPRRKATRNATTWKGVRRAQGEPGRFQELDRALSQVRFEEGLENVQTVHG